MKLYNHHSGIILEEQGRYYTVDGNWDTVVNRTGLHTWLRNSLPAFTPLRAFDVTQPMLPPIGSQEIWAAGVTYYRSREARMEESKEAGGGSFYDKVYHAERPELFFKSLPARISGHKGEIRIRRDSQWNVPEPELTLFVSSAGTIEGITIGNDVSSRSIEGENPLYLPQAKTYQFSAALGPCLHILDLEKLEGGTGDTRDKDWSGKTGIRRDTEIRLEIIRGDRTIFDQSTTLQQMKRTPEELVGWLFRETEFPQGVYLMTGTGIVPPDDFTLQSGDDVRISIDEIGTMVNTVGIRP
jgi:2-dehydro-3-deoxy-D-arabinonate dehydratase